MDLWVLAFGLDNGALSLRSGHLSVPQLLNNQPSVRTYHDVIVRVVVFPPDPNPSSCRFHKGVTGGRGGGHFPVVLRMSHVCFLC